MVFLTYDEGKNIITDTFGIEVIYNDDNYDGSDGLVERIDIYTILKTGFFELLTNIELYPEFQDRFELMAQISDFLRSNKNRWDGPKLGTHDTINITLNQVKDTRHKIQNNSYHFGETGSLFPLSVLDSTRDFVQIFTEYDTNLLYKLVEKTSMEAVVEKLIHTSIEDWLYIDNDINLGKDDRTLKYIHKNFIKMNSEFIYKCLENKQSIMEEIEFYNFTSSVYKTEHDMFWKVINPYAVRSHKSFDVFQTLIQLGSTSLDADTRDFFVRKHLELSIDKFGSSGLSIGYTSLFTNWVIKIYSMMYSFYYGILSKLFNK